MEEELRVINKGRNKTINIDEYFHILVGYILSSKVNVENKLVLKK